MMLFAVKIMVQTHREKYDRNNVSHLLYFSEEEKKSCLCSSWLSMAQ